MQLLVEKPRNRPLIQSQLPVLGSHFPGTVGNLSGAARESLTVNCSNDGSKEFSKYTSDVFCC
jgi:hypothetical protein